MKKPIDLHATSRYNMMLIGGDHMEYTVQKLAKLAGVSTRTLRYYDEIGLLQPARINSSGYRIYGPPQVSRLQQIMFYRELGVRLEAIEQLLNAPDFDEVRALEAHRTQLLERHKQLEVLIENVTKTIAEKEGSIQMSDQEKFNGFKQKMIAENEAQYGEEIRAKYGHETIDASNAKFANLSQEAHEKVTQLSNRFNEKLIAAFREGDPAGPLAQEAADLHRQWLSHFWPEGLYTPEAHYGLAQMYVADPRFTAYYDAIEKGSAQFLEAAIKIYTKQ